MNFSLAVVSIRIDIHVYAHCVRIYVYALPIKSMDTNLDLRDPRKYETAFHLLPTLSEADATKAFDEIGTLIAEKEGLSFDEGAPQRMGLQYPIDTIIDNKRTMFEEAYFAWIRFDVVPDALEDIAQAVKNHESVLRSLCISIDEKALVKPQEAHTVDASSDEETEEASDTSSDDEEEA